jgi:hypothetical protein
LTERVLIAIMSLFKIRQNQPIERQGDDRKNT